MIKTKPVVLGLGNPLFQDEGLGIHVIHQLMAGELTDRAELVDGGTDGLALLGIVEEASHLLVIDAINGSLPPGTVQRLAGADIPMLAQAKLSQHQVSFQEVLALAHLREKLPADLILIGVQPKSMGWGTQLTPEVAQAVPAVVGIVEEQVDRWLRKSEY